ncbi:MAG: hypothetical protein ACE5Z5_04750 [Candidatus Bathyarchaeia archaeon]
MDDNDGKRRDRRKLHLPIDQRTSRLRVREDRGIYLHPTRQPTLRAVEEKVAELEGVEDAEDIIAE